jgi:ABC-type amino acid transport system permease subunit
VKSAVHPALWRHRLPRSGRGRQNRLHLFDVARVHVSYFRGVPMLVILPVVLLIVVVMTFAKRKQKW